MLQEKYKIPIFDFRNNYINFLKNERDKRKLERVWNKGFKAPEEGENFVHPENDPELDEEAGDFDKAIGEIDAVKKIFASVQETFINGNFFDDPGVAD